VNPPRTRRPLGLRALALLAAILALAPNPGAKRHGMILKVDPSQPAAFQTIGQAVAAARQFDTIDISPSGNPYRECVDVRRRFDLRITAAGGRARIDATGACPSSQPAFGISLSRHVIVQNVDLAGNPAGAGFLVDHSGDIRFAGVTASGFSGCGLVSTLSVVGLFVDLSRFTDNPGGGLCLNGNGFWITNTATDRNGNGGIVLQGVAGGVAMNVFVNRLIAGPDEPAGIAPQPPAGLHNVFVARSTFGTRGLPAGAGAEGITGAGRNLQVDRSYFYGMGIHASANGSLTGNVVTDCVGPGFALGPGPLSMILSSNTAQGCTGPGFDLAGAFAYRNRSGGNGGGGLVAGDGVFLEQNAASVNGGAGISRTGTDNGGRRNTSTDPVPADFR